MFRYIPLLAAIIALKIFSQTSDTLSVFVNHPKTDSTIAVTISDSLLTSDSTQVLSQIIKVDSLKPIQESPLSDGSLIINKKTFLFMNYRYTGDFLRSFSMNFIKDLAFVGQPNETFIYGSGDGGISFLQDGVLWNNRNTNSLNLNYVQSEDIDSIEIVPSPRGFLFGPLNNPVTINFIMRDFISPVPYTRIRYYEGPDGEAMIDGKFNAQIYKRWNLSLQLTNRSNDDRYTNSDYSMWQTNAKLKWLLSNSVNISLLYNSVDSEIGLNGGVDIESISTDINSVLYNAQLAPVVYPNRIKNVLNHNFRLKLQTLPFSNAKLDVSFYYRYSNDELKNDLDTVRTRNVFDNKTLGSALRYNQKIGIVNLRLLGNYEKNNLEVTNEEESKSTYTKEFNYYSVAGLISLNIIENKLIPSFYYKYFNQRYSANGKIYTNNNSGYGLDLFYNPFEGLSIYAGYSVYSQFEKDKVQSIESGIRYNKQNVFVDLKYFVQKNFIPYSSSIPYWTGIEITVPEMSIKGAGLIANFGFGKLLFETNSSYYYDLVNYSFSLPKVQFVGGVYLKDKFFNENLDLKAGVVFHYTGRITANEGLIVDPSQKVDISIAGEIKKVAIVYFIWENIADNKYYITPYYPMPGRNIRFGLSWELFN